METHGRYVLIGSFTILGFAGIVAFLLWFGAAQLNRQFTDYDVLFDSVSGITRSSEVRFAGLPVGQVQSLELDPAGSGKVLVHLEVAANTPVRADSIATLEAQGVTGTSVVAISAGQPNSELLSNTTEGVPVIRAGRSTLQDISESAPAVLNEALEVIEQVNELLSPSNRAHVASIIENLDTSSEKLSSMLDSADKAMGEVGGAVDSLAKLTEVADSLSGKVGPILDNADAAISDFASLKGQAEAALESGRSMLDTAEHVLDTNVSPTLDNLSKTAATLRETVDRLAPATETLMDTWSETGRKASARLDDTEALITSLKRTADAIDAQTAEKLNRALDQIADDLPGLTADIRNAGEKASAAFTSLDGMISGARGPVVDFVDRGLPQFTRLADEARRLIATLNGLATSLRRNPAGTLLRNDMPEFRR